MRIVHLLNGDCALEEWREAKLPGEAMVWRENYLQGVIPTTDNPADFRQIRAAELHKISPEMPERQILSELELMDQKLFAFSPKNHLFLWFDTCPFDRTMLSRILHLLSSTEIKTTVSLIFENIVWTSEEFKRHFPSARQLSPADLQYGSDEWQKYLKGASPESLLTRFIY